MEGFAAFSRYVAVRLHFEGKYDFHKYGGKTRVNTDTFSKRRDSFFFRKLERKYFDIELTHFFVANIIKTGGRTWSGELVTAKAEDIYLDWKRRNESLTYLVGQELTRLNEMAPGQEAWVVPASGHPLALRELIGGRLSLETVVGADTVIGFMPYWTKRIVDDVIWPDVRRTITKYAPFMHLSGDRLETVREKVMEIYHAD